MIFKTALLTLTGRFPARMEDRISTRVFGLLFQCKPSSILKSAVTNSVQQPKGRS